MARLSLAGVRKSFGAVNVLTGIDLDIETGEFVVFVGPSGCGKSTLLRMIAGLETISGGEMTLDGQRLNDVPAARRGVAMVFQNYALYPHMTVRGNLSYGLRIAGTPRDSIEAKVMAAARMLQIDRLLDRRPGQLSGGQRQRVAIGRALVRDPRLFLFDEPLSNLDAALRTATRVEIARLKAGMPQTTMIYVTHDQTEAMTLADRIVVLNEGRIEQAGTPLDLYHRPANRFVAGFIGSPAMNFLPPRAVSGDWPAEVAEIGLRPEDLRPSDPALALVRGQIELCERLGEVTMVHLVLPYGERLVAKIAGDAQVRPGQDLALNAPLEKLHAFASDGTRWPLLDDPA